MFIFKIEWLLVARIYVTLGLGKAAVNAGGFFKRGVGIFAFLDHIHKLAQVNKLIADYLSPTSSNAIWEQ